MKPIKIIGSFRGPLVKSKKFNVPNILAKSVKGILEFLGLLYNIIMEKLTCYDIMVGDYVYRPDCYDKVVEVRKDSILGSDPLRGLIPIADLQPIPLTAEILEKSGFKLYKQDFTSRRVYKFGCFDYIEINDYNENNRYNYFSIGCYKEYEHFGTLQKYIHDVMKIRYVHELQHALRLCGIDNEIVL